MDKKHGRQTQVDKVNREQAKSKVQNVQTGQSDKRELVQGNKDSLAEAELKYTERLRWINSGQSQ